MAPSLLIFEDSERWKETYQACSLDFGYYITIVLLLIGLLLTLQSKNSVWLEPDVLKKTIEDSFNPLVWVNFLNHWANMHVAMANKECQWRSFFQRE